MKYFTYKNHKPQIDKSVFVAEGAIIIGRVTLEKDASVWFNCVLRGDVNDIIIGENSNIQDLSMLHVDSNSKIHIGKNVTIGHSVTLHGCKIGDGSLVGMGSTILDHAEIGHSSLVGAGSLIPPGKVYPPGVLIMGNPGKVIRNLTEEEISKITNHYKSYVNYKNEFMNGDVLPLTL